MDPLQSCRISPQVHRAVFGSLKGAQPDGAYWHGDVTRYGQGLRKRVGRGIGPVKSVREAGSGNQYRFKRRAVPAPRPLQQRSVSESYSTAGFLRV